MLRAARRVWPHPALDQVAAIRPGGLHQPVALGAVAAVAGLDPHAAALAAAHDSVVGPAIAAVRLLGLDPFAVHGALARLGAQLDAAAAAGAAHTHTPPAELPAWTTPLLDICAEHHATWEVRLFAS
jgi:urease accessory protein